MMVPSVDVQAVDRDDRRFEAADEIVGDATRVGRRLRPDAHLLPAARRRAAPFEVGNVLTRPAIEPRRDPDFPTVVRFEHDRVRADLVDRRDLVETRELVPIDDRTRERRDR